MASQLQKFTRFPAAAALALSLLTGCTQTRVYDPEHHDYHSRSGEAPYYAQWEHDTHRDHVDFDHRSDADKKEYWDWRHKH